MYVLVSEIPADAPTARHNCRPTDEDKTVLSYDLWSDEELLVCSSGDPGDTFAAFYRRHKTSVQRYCASRGLDAHEAADLCAETFSAALLARQRYRADRASASTWLIAIAAHKLADRARRWARERSACARLGLQAPALTDADIGDYAALVDETATSALDRLPRDQRDAVTARVIDDQDYDEIAAHEQVSQATARKRVSRGLAALRIRVEDER